MILDTVTRTARIVLGEGVTTTAPTVVAFWADQTSGTGGFLPGNTNTATNGVTPVTVVAAPGANVQRAVTEIRVYNADSVQHTVTLQLDDNSTIYDVETYTVPAGDTYTYLSNSASSTNASTASSASILVESGSSTKISAMSAASALKGTESMAGVQSGGNVQITGNELGLLVLSDAFTTYPLDPVSTTGNGTAALIRGGNGGSVSGNGANIEIEGGSATSGNGGSVVLQGGSGTGTTGQVLVNTASNDGVSALQVNGVAMATTAVKVGSSTGPSWTQGSGAPGATTPIGSLYSNTSGSIGSSLYVSEGSGTWSPVSQTWVEISTTTPAGSSGQNIAVTGFRRYRFQFQQVTVNTSAASLQVQFSINAGSSFIASGYAQFGFYSFSTTMTAFNQSGTSVLLSIGISTASSAVLDGYYEFWPGTASQVALWTGTSTFFNTTPAWTMGQFGGALGASGVVNMVKIFPSSGTVSGTIVLLGLV